ncbi:MAG: amino acid ABC transporter permease [bacterium]
MSTPFDFSVILNNIVYFMIGRYPKGPLGGLGLTIYLAVISCLLSFIGGLILGLMNISHRWYLKYPSKIFVHFIRGLPLLMVIFWMYFLLPALIGKTVPETATVIMALTVFTSAYMSQIVKAGIEGVPKGQMEAAISTGLKPWQAMLYIILPQGLRNMIPSFVNQFVSMIKDTSLAFIVGVSELTHVATQINNRTMAYPFEIFTFIAVVYFIICYIFTSFSRYLEKRLSWKKPI